MESVGEKLREARLRLGLTLEQVSADTRITLKNLSAIESNDLSSINSRFFYRSFVRQYAAKVEVDFASILSGLEEAASTMPEPLVPGQERTHTIRVAPLKPRRQGTLQWVRSVVSFCFVITVCSAMYGLWQNSKSDWRSLLARINAHLPLVKTVAAPETKTAEQAETITSAAALPDLELDHPDFRVQLSALEESWLSIVADGRQVFSGMLNTSETKILEGHEFARIRTGNAGGLSFTFNGKEIGILGRRGQVRTVVFTKNKYQVLRAHPQLAFASFIQDGE